MMDYIEMMWDGCGWEEDSNLSLWIYLRQLEEWQHHIADKGECKRS